MSEIDVDHSASPTLRSRAAGHSVMQKCLELQDEAPHRGRLARALGRSPLHPDAVSWYQGALGELETGRRLAALGAGYTLLHSLPIGTAPGAGTSMSTSTSTGTSAGSSTGSSTGTSTGISEPDVDVEHLVIGPAGVFCLRSTHGVTPERAAAVQLEARQASKHLSRTLQRVVPVTPLLVIVAAGGGAGMPAGGVAAGVDRVTSTVAKVASVEAVASRELPGWFAKRGPVLTTAELANLTLAAEKPETWHASPPTVAVAPSAAPSVSLSVASTSGERQVPADPFDALKSEVEAASDRERVALAVAVTVAVLVVLGSSAVILDSLAPSLFAH